MEKSNEWHLMIVGGAFNGRERVFSGDSPVVVGRSHTANVQLPKSDADVSGRHVEFVVIDGIAHVRNLSQTRPVRVNGVDVPMGGRAPVQTGDMVELGGRVRVRLDAVPQTDNTLTIPEAIPAATATAATKFFEGDGSLDIPTAVMEEASVTSSGGFVSPAPPPENLTSATRVPDGMTSATRVPDGMTSATRVPDGMTSATRVPNSMLSDDSETETGDGASGDGKTVEGETRAGSWEEIQAMKVTLDRRRKIRRFFIAGIFVLIAAALVAGYVVLGFMGTESGMSWPTNADGKDDVVKYAIKNAKGDKLLEVDYPGNPKITETKSPDDNGITVLTWYGKRRDVPYFLMFEATSHPDELHIDLMTSVRRWIAKAKTSGEGFVFDERILDELRTKFFEDAYPRSCETKTLHGVRFVEFEYKRTWQDGKLWHGWAHYFRSGDTVYLLRREIPDFYWERGARRIKTDPSLAIYASFSETYWESPGDEKLVERESPDELKDMIRGALAKKRASDWRFLRHGIDTLLVRAWRTDAKTREFAESCLRQYRDVLRVYYHEKHNAFFTAKDNREEKKMRRIRQDAQAVFDNPDERYYHLVNNGEVW